MASEKNGWGEPIKHAAEIGLWVGAAALLGAAIIG